MAEVIEDQYNYDKEMADLSEFSTRFECSFTSFPLVSSVVFRSGK